jgi:hypothetical protein
VSGAWIGPDEGGSAGGLAAKHVMMAVGDIDKLRIYAGWLAEYAKSEPAPLPDEFLDHLSVIPAELLELRDTYVILLRRYSQLAADAAEEAARKAAEADPAEAVT